MKLFLKEMLIWLKFQSTLDLQFALISTQLLNFGGSISQSCFKTVVWVPVEPGKTMIESDLQLTSVYCSTWMLIKTDFHVLFLNDNFLNFEIKIKSHYFPTFPLTCLMDCPPPPAFSNSWPLFLHCYSFLFIEYKLLRYSLKPFPPVEIQFRKVLEWFYVVLAQNDFNLREESQVFTLLCF